MTNDDIRSQLVYFSNSDDTILLEGDEFADGAIGVTDDGHIVYGYFALVDALMDAWSCTEEEAMEYLGFNTIRSLPYMKTEGIPPIIVYEFEK